MSEQKKGPQIIASHLMAAREDATRNNLHAIAHFKESKDRINENPPVIERRISLN